VRKYTKREISKEKRHKVIISGMSVGALILPVVMEVYTFV
jgi:hypothetical protein